MKESASRSYLSAGEEYIDALYEDYLQNPESVPQDVKKYFDSLAEKSEKKDVSHAGIREEFLEIAKNKYNAMVCEEESKANIYRKLGHFHANLDPLNLMPKPSVPELEGPDDAETTQLKKLYCNTIGAEFMHILNQDEVRWLQNRFENPEFRKPLSLEEQKHILLCLIAADGLEKYLGVKFVGQKRFSLEGGDSLIVLLDTLVQYAGKNNVKEMAMAMSHRGRLNVLVNILGKPPQELFDEFEGKNHDDNYSGDVKYHLGFSSDIKTPGGVTHVSLAFNPSHLEIISPVAIGSVRARQDRNGHDVSEVLGVAMHGDAAFAGQGCVMETFALSQTKGFGTGGTIHIVINNQVGFTTDPRDGRSTYYCTDIAKMIEAPIFHVNGDDPEAVLFLAKLALDYRKTFAKDIVIDLICYRRHGHNEADEPAATQPVMYKAVRAHPTPRQIYADKLIAEKKLTQEEVSAEVEAYRDALDKAKDPLAPIVTDVKNPHAEDWAQYLHAKLPQKIWTKVSLSVLKKLALQINTLPKGMTLQPQVAKMIEDNLKMAKDEIPMNWGFAENLAYATLLNEGLNIRLSGQDVGRGTFAHRHAIWHDYQTGEIFVPLSSISEKSTFSAIDSILSEEAVLAFEYGYSSTTPKTLVLWEAQFGDFANGAQVVIDQFISAGEQKWKRLSGLVMLLPHGYEGMGPEHSSARLERYLQLCAQDNMQVCVPTTPAQMFHLLRRQMVQKARKPLIVMTPKSLLRHKSAVSTLKDLSEGDFQRVILPPTSEIKAVKRIILCSGRIYYDLSDAKEKNKIEDVAIIRLEQLYPFPEDEIKTVLKEKEIIWCQEEPQNQGAWRFIRDYLPNAKFVGRKAAASTAEGLAKAHAKMQQEVVMKALM